MPGYHSSDPRTDNPSFGYLAAERANLLGVPKLRVHRSKKSIEHDGETRFARSWSLVLHDKPHPGTVRTYENRLRRFLNKLGIRRVGF